MSLTRIVLAGAAGGFLSIFTSWLITGGCSTATSG